ncbi:MAG TPA: SUMF1/EgtB/PvdO family nonheme iron enzyme [Anaerolineaceae bacterium]|nr:SUMF1/EgtB/PvdO family nonheme iron enzyme [Anaerolineaceae bacterium]HPN54015.1 SUMF1/EgtB/PvdO family nonheme iron enzyme [Anaerolineaceae bacterium]
MALNLIDGTAINLAWIPAGEFWMGSDEAYFQDDNPKHSVSLPGFWMGRQLVTNAQYQVFVCDTHHAAPPGGFPFDKENHPVVNVSWTDAMAFACWLNNQFSGQILPDMVLRLPTEAEWEKAARGTDGRTWPWGNKEAKPRMCNYKNSRLRGTSPVGAYSPDGDSPYGCADMAGNVWEWTHSRYCPYPYQVLDGREAEEGTDLRALRGGAFGNNALSLRCSSRSFDFPGSFHANVGFRVCVGSRFPRLM